MAIKKATESNGGSSSAPERKKGVDANKRRQQARTMGRQQTAAESIAASTVQLTANTGQAVDMQVELKSAMGQITAGAQQASGSAEVSQSAITSAAEKVKSQMDDAKVSSEKTLQLQGLLDEVDNGIGSLVDNVSMAADNQLESTEKIANLEKIAADIDEAVRAVIRIADQTNLLALNAAIEAARAGKHGKGFAVVADTVRTLAETAETNGANIAELVKKIQEQASKIATAVRESAESARTEVEKGRNVTVELAGIKSDMQAIFNGSQEILTAATQMETASAEAQGGSESIAAAAEEQLAACEQSIRTLEEQERALDEMSNAAGELDELSEDLKNSTDISKDAEEVAAAAEELSSNTEEMNRAASEISRAIEEISRASSQQATAAEQASTAMQQIEDGVGIAVRASTEAVEKADLVTTRVAENKTAVDNMIAAIVSAAEGASANLDEILELDRVAAQIDKIVDQIANVSIQTSMLAVNGAVEAARAGEYGKGFAVVSTDIQNLANDAAENVELIKEKTSEIQDQIRSVSGDLSSVLSNVNIEVENSKATTSRLVVIEADANAVVDGNRNILEASKFIDENIAAAKTAVEQIAAAAEQAATAANQASQAGGAQGKVVSELAVAIEEIAATADDLQQ